MPTPQRSALRQRPVRAVPAVYDLYPGAQSLKNINVNPGQLVSDAYFVHAVTLGAIAPGNTASGVVQIQGDAIFEVRRLAFSAYIGGTTLATTPLLTLQLNDGSSQANMFQEPVPLWNVAYGGAGFGPFDLPAPRYFAPNATVLVTVFNIDATNNYTVKLNLQGRKIFKR